MKRGGINPEIPVRKIHVDEVVKNGRINGSFHLLVLAGKLKYLPNIPGSPDPGLQASPTLVASKESASLSPVLTELESAPKMPEPHSTPSGSHPERRSSSSSSSAVDITHQQSVESVSTPTAQQETPLHQIPSPDPTENLEFSTPLSSPENVTTNEEGTSPQVKQDGDVIVSPPPSNTRHLNDIKSEEREEGAGEKAETGIKAQSESKSDDNLDKNDGGLASRSSYNDGNLENENKQDLVIAPPPSVIVETLASPVAVETLKSQMGYPGKSAGTGNPGYLDGTRGTGGGYESDDSLMTTSRRDSVSGSENVPTFLGFSRRQVLTLIVFGLADFFSAVIISLQAPFYPAEATKRGATSTEYGLVFGVFELVVFLTSPIYGRYIGKVGPKLLFNLGIFTTGVTTIIFGLLGLEAFNFDRTTFIALSFVVRSLEACADAAFITASFAIIATEFPNSVATTFASLETFFGLGLIVGPTVGGALYEQGGFPLPFCVMGGLLLVVAVLALFLMPNIKPNQKQDNKNPGGIFTVLKVPGVLLASLNIVAGAITIGFLNATLEPHLREFNLSPVLTGLVFIINGGLYAISAPVWGYICDKRNAPRYVLLVGSLVTATAFLFIGPVPFIPLNSMLWLICTGLVIHGLGLGATLVSSFIMALRDSISNGFADNIQTYGLTSALWTSSFALGSFIGPSVGGLLLFYVEFGYASLFVFAVQIFTMILIIAYITNSPTTPGRSYTESNLSETAPLLQDPCSSKSLVDNGERKASYGATGDIEC